MTLGSRVPPLDPPVPGGVVVAFSSTGPYGPGHRGVDLAAAPGTQVRAPAAGRVVFAGPVAGVRWVTLDVAPRVRVTVGPLEGLRVAVGDVVAAGHGLARLAPGHDGAVHLSVRVDGTYVDPAPHLVETGRGTLLVARLLPVDRSSAVPSGVR